MAIFSTLGTAFRFVIKCSTNSLMPLVIHTSVNPQ